jgi:hypothetical protein
MGPAGQAILRQDVALFARAVSPFQSEAVRDDL